LIGMLPGYDEAPTWAITDPEPAPERPAPAAPAAGADWGF